MFSITSENLLNNKVFYGILLKKNENTDEFKYIGITDPFIIYSTNLDTKLYLINSNFSFNMNIYNDDMYKFILFGVNNKDNDIQFRNLMGLFIECSTTDNIINHITYNENFNIIFNTSFDKDIFKNYSSENLSTVINIDNEDLVKNENFNMDNVKVKFFVHMTKTKNPMFCLPYITITS